MGRVGENEKKRMIPRLLLCLYRSSTYNVEHVDSVPQARVWEGHYRCCFHIEHQIKLYRVPKPRHVFLSLETQFRDAVARDSLRRTARRADGTEAGT